MGTYTTNYNLFLPSIGEQGWGELVNGNFITIDTTIKGLDTRIGTLETKGDIIAAKVTVLEPLSIIHVDENHNVTFPASVDADLSPSMNLTTESNKISAIYLSTNILLGESKGTAVTNTYTYVENPISNTVEFAYTAYGQSGSVSTREGRVYIKINGTIVADTGTVTSTKSGSYRTTLENNDVIEVYVYTNNKGAGASASTIYLKSYGYLTN